MANDPLALQAATLEELELALSEPFETSFGVERRRRFLLLELTSRAGVSGWGECVAARDPLYSEESTATARWMITNRLLPLLRRLDPVTIDGFRAQAGRYRGHRMAKAAVEGALVDLAARERGVPLGTLLGKPARSEVRVGVSVGIQPSPSALVQRVARYCAEGYRRVKLKVAPGRDREWIAAVRKEFPELELWVDANQAYGRQDARRLRAWVSDLAVAQVEQPFGERELSLHALLQRHARFRVCLDESIVDEASLREAVTLRAGNCLNVKAGRVGGGIEGFALATVARRTGWACWVGGMLESGIGRAHNLHLASLAPFNLSSDLSASSRYYEEDLIEQPFELTSRSTIRLPTGPGSGVRIDPRVRRRALVRQRRFRLAPGLR